MARLIAGIGTSHVPSIAAALDKGLRDSDEWKPFFDGYIPAQRWVADHKPDIAVVVYNDHGNAFFLDRVPTIALGVAEDYHPIDEGWGPRALAPFIGAADFAWHLADSMVTDHFDPMLCRDLGVDHGFQVPMELVFGRPKVWPVKVVPILINTIQFPIPTPQRMWDLGCALRAAIDSWPGDERIVVLGTGGLSHQLQGARAGFINPPEDRAWIENIGPAPDRYRQMSREDYVEVFGSEGAELIMLLVMRGCMDDRVNTLARHYFAPASMTGAGMVLLENA